MTERTWNLIPKKFCAVLLGISVILNIISAAVWYIPRRFQISVGRMYELFYVDNEYNFPTLYSVLLFTICGLLLVYIYSAVKSEKGKYQFHWIILAIGFFYFACDDFMVLHEKLTKPTNVILRSFKLGGLVDFSWVLPASIVLILVALYFIPFLLKLPRRTQILLLVGGLLFFGAALGLETIGGQLKSVFGIWSREYVIETQIEEFLELVGPIVVIYALLEYISTRFGILHIRVLPEKVGKDE